MRPSLLTAALALGALLPALAFAADAQCSARSGASTPLVVELYTSEGCSSCPPADRWLSTLKGRGDVVALAFHVDYWDRLGWKDRFASADWTRRQSAVGAHSGAGFSYTPQVLVNGRDYRRWPALPAAGSAPVVDVQLERDGAGYVAQVTPRPGNAPRALAGYWAVTEDGHRTQVRSGENAGAALSHDAVVRELLPLAAIGQSALRFTPRDASVAPGTTRRVQFVVTDPASGAPLQALGLGC